jgi:hypothetical protein
MDDLGETIPGVVEVGLFLVDVEKAESKRVTLEEGVLPCYPVFAGHDVYFHGIKDSA